MPRRGSQPWSSSGIGGLVSSATTSTTPRGSAVDDLEIHLFAGPGGAGAMAGGERRRLADGLWLKIAKKGAPEPSVTYAEALELALCFGWIDSQKRGLDETHFLQRFTPRRPRGRWSKINREKAEALEAAGAMRPAGAAEVAAAKDDGRWEAAYAGARTAEVPDDLQRELDANPAAACVLRRARRRQPLRDPLPPRRGEKARDPRPPPRQIRRHARARRKDPRLTGARLPCAHGNRRRAGDQRRRRPPRPGGTTTSPAVVNSGKTRAAPWPRTSPRASR